jgi:alanine racemase
VFCISTSDIARITGGTLYGPSDTTITDISTDSRQVSFTSDVAFIAIIGKNHDGHLFIEGLSKKGIRVFLVSRLPENIGNYTGTSFILLNDTVDGLQKLASFKRSLYNFPVIAVTGSTGKTIVKEWLADILGRTEAVVRSPRSYNSQIGVPLSVWKMDERFRYAVFEAGISMPGEMEKLRNVIQPGIGIITNIGEAHSSNFNDNRAKAREKLGLFTDCSMIIFCADHEVIRELVCEDNNLSGKNLVSWSFHDEGATVFVKSRLNETGLTSLEVSYKAGTEVFEIPFSDRASVENAVTVASACLALGIDRDIIRKGLSQLQAVAMRMEIKGGINNCLLIEDYYNSDPGSLGMALEFMKSQNGRTSILILSDFVQSGRNEEELYGETAELIRKTGINRLIGIGPSLMRCRRLFEPGSGFYASTDDFERHFSSRDFRDSVILIKGARMFEFERIARLLEQQAHITVLEVSLDTITHNLNEIRRLLNPGTRIMAMVKAFAYGAGSAEIAGILEYNRISYLAVAYPDEGAELRNAGVSLPIMVMNPDPASYDVLIRYNLEPEIYSLSALEKFRESASRHGLFQYPVHIKIDTGMHRLGFLVSETDRLISVLKQADCLKVASVFSHLSGSEDPALDEFTHHQASLFEQVSGKINTALGYSFLRHLLNTSGIIRFPRYQYDMVRPGIGIYGAGNYEGMNLRPAGRFMTAISQVKYISPGEPVGYGCASVSDRERKIAILPVGYADGLNRRLGNGKGSVFIKDRRYPLTGNICMDMCMADITGSDIEEGCAAEIFGENISINEVARICGTIPYEILTSVPARVKRVFYRE